MLTHLEQNIHRVTGLFTLQTASDIRLTVNPNWDDRHNPLDAKAQATLREAIVEDKESWGGRRAISTTYQHLSDELKKENSDINLVSNLVIELKKLTELYDSKARPLVGVANIRVENGTITGDCGPTPTVVYQKYSKAGAPQDVLDYSAVIGTSAVLVATDENGKKWLQVQARNATKNFPHGGNIGCSPAGLLRFNSNAADELIQRVQEILKDAKNSPTDIDISKVKDNLTLEAKQEIGLIDPRIVNHELIGLGYDETSPHFEALNLLTSKLSKKEMTDLGMERNRELAKKEKKHPHDFAEAFFWIPAEPEAIRQLVLKAVHGPATHIANFVALGTRLVAQETNETTAKAWQHSLMQELGTTWENCGKTVDSFYKSRPDMFFKGIHQKEKNSKALSEYITKQTERSTDELQRELTNQTVNNYLNEALKLTEDATEIRSLILVAHAMENKIVHIPSNNSFDPRRTPEAQGLASAKEVIKELSAAGIQIDPGTMAIFE